MSDFFPPADQSLENPRPVEVEGGLVLRVMTSEDGRVAFAVVVPQEGKDVLYRFTLPRHNRVVRQFFRRGKIREVPMHRENFDVEGVFAISFRGDILGEDDIPEDLEKKPEHVYVLSDVTAQVLV